MRFLVLILTSLILSACTANEDRTSAGETSRRAVGVETKAGQSLTAKELCSDLKTDATGKSTVDTYQFNKNSSYVRRTLMIDSQIQYAPVSTTKGYWGLFQDSILFNDKGVQTRVALKSIENSNGTTCFQIGNAPEIQTYCPCN